MERKNRRVVKRVNADPGFTRAFVPIRRDTAARKPASIHIDVARRRDAARPDQASLASLAPSVDEPRTITQVYQPMYADGVAATGLGDFVRGCLGLTQLCAMLQWSLRISLAAHPVARWLAYPSPYPRDTARVHRWAELNHRPLLLAGKEITHESDLEPGEMVRRFRDAVREHGDELCSIAFPPMTHFAPHQKRVIARALTPTRDIRAQVDAFIRSLASPTFCVLHVRAGDDTFTHAMAEERIAAIRAVISFEETMPCVLLTDSLALRAALCHNHPLHVFSDAPPAHTCSATVDQLRTTVAELHILSRAHHIRAFSVYNHGSGFSKWIAFLHDIPYQCHLIPT